MSIKVGINGFGRIGRLVLRAAWDWPELEFVQINDPAADAATHAHLLNFDSVHGRWTHQAQAVGETIMIGDRALTVTANKAIADTDWSGCDVVIEASGKMKTVAVLQDYLKQGVKRVVVSAPVKEAGALNVVMGVNQHLFDPAVHRIVTAASCTTNCLAPVVKVIHEHLGIRHGSITTIHDLTNTQSLLDQPHKDLRRARASGMSLIPTTTGIVALARSGNLFGGQDCGDLLYNQDSILSFLLVVLTMVSGTAVIMWLGELITDRGVGNGMSILIFTQVTATFPGAMWGIQQQKGWATFVLVVLVGLVIVAAVIS